MVLLQPMPCCRQALRPLRRLLREARQRWPVLPDFLIIHKCDYKHAIRCCESRYASFLKIKLKEDIQGFTRASEVEIIGMGGK